MIPREVADWVYIHHGYFVDQIESIDMVPDFDKYVIKVDGKTIEVDGIQLHNESSLWDLARWGLAFKRASAENPGKFDEIREKYKEIYGCEQQVSPTSNNPLNSEGV